MNNNEKFNSHSNRCYERVKAAMQKYAVHPVLLILCTGLFTVGPIQAQVSLNMNISAQALWGPVGYDYVEYYYLPEIDVFYYVPTRQFICPNGYQWAFSPGLPPRYRVDLYSTYKVVVNQPKPYLHHEIYVTKYGKYKRGGPKQHYIRDSNDPRYFGVKGHPRHSQHGGGKHDYNKRSNDGRNHQDSKGGKSNSGHQNNQTKGSNEKHKEQKHK